MQDRLSCARHELLLNEVQRRLIRIAELAHAELDALNSKSHNLWREIDQQLEIEIGEKERAIGALNEHRTEHGC